MISLPNVSKMLAICCLVLATPFPSLASDRDGRVTEALETVQEIAEFSSPGSMPTPLVRRCFVAVDRLLGPVDIHLAAMTVAARCQLAA